MLMSSYTKESSSPCSPQYMRTFIKDFNVYMSKCTPMATCTTTYIHVQVDGLLYNAGLARSAPSQLASC